ncbi:MAG: PHP domain-containing protein [Leptolyngbya sp. RL_3_1]|nr:PHP domain-containing protein [Leptolyngbya sp. RL_3_1]
MATSTTRLGTNLRASARGALALRGIFETVDASSCPGQYNFHMHTVCSDGQLTPAELIEQAIALGLKEFAVTDHHTLKGYYQAKQYMEDWQWRHPAPIRRDAAGRVSRGLPRLWAGVEITSKLAGTEVHILGYAFKPNHDVIQPYLQGGSLVGEDRLAENVIAAIQGAGGLAVLAHPGRYRRPPEDLVPEAAKRGIDGVETYYAYSNPTHWQPCPKKTPVIQALAQEFDLLSTCGTDTHGKSLTRRV